MVRLTRWMVRRFMPDCILINNVTTIDDWKAFCGPILKSRGYHIAKKPAKGPDRKKRQVIPEIPT